MRSNNEVLLEAGKHVITHESLVQEFLRDGCTHIEATRRAEQLLATLGVHPSGSQGEVDIDE